MSESDLTTEERAVLAAFEVAREALAAARVEHDRTVSSTSAQEAARLNIPALEREYQRLWDRVFRVRSSQLGELNAKIAFAKEEAREARRMVAVSTAENSKSKFVLNEVRFRARKAYHAHQENPNNPELKRVLDDARRAVKMETEVRKLHRNLLKQARETSAQKAAAYALAKASPSPVETLSLFEYQRPPEETPENGATNE
jgi:hypothetical protein